MLIFFTQDLVGLEVQPLKSKIEEVLNYPILMLKISNDKIN